VNDEKMRVGERKRREERSTRLLNSILKSVVYE
jgi:hypothetical protein